MKNWVRFRRKIPSYRMTRHRLTISSVKSVQTLFIGQRCQKMPVQRTQYEHFREPIYCEQPYPNIWNWNFPTFFIHYFTLDQCIYLILVTPWVEKGINRSFLLTWTHISQSKFDGQHYWSSNFKLRSTKPEVPASIRYTSKAETSLRV